MILCFSISLYAQNSNGLQLLNSSVTNDGFIRYIVGSVRNNSGRSFSQVMVTFNLYDSSGALVGNAVDSVFNMSPGMVWRFRAPVPEDSATNFSLQSIDGF